MSGFRVSQKKKRQIAIHGAFLSNPKEKSNHFNDANMGPTLFLQKAS